MKNYIVTPTCGAYKAPSIYVQSENSQGAEKKAKEHSGLSRFPQWIFIAAESKNNK